MRGGVITIVQNLPGCSRYATGVPGSLNHLLGIYGVLSFSIGLLGTWSASNNAAMFAEVWHQGRLTSPSLLQLSPLHLVLG